MKKIVFSLLLAALLISAKAQKIKPLTLKQIDSLVDITMKRMPLAGLAVAVVKDGKIIHSKGYGVASIRSKEKVDEHTLFAIASNSKAFTTMALAMLVDEGKLSWKDEVTQYIPEFKMYDPYVTANFNIQDLLTHRSGLGLGAGDLMFFPDGSDFTVNDVIRSFQFLKPVSAFRTKYDYDNLLYVVAGEVVARVSGLSWTDFVESRIMRPLGMMRSAGVYQTIKDRKNIAMPHSVLNSQLNQFEPYAKNDPSLGAAGGIYASVGDLSKWMMLHLNDGRYGERNQHQLVSKENHQEMLRPHTFIGFNQKPDQPDKIHFNAYGLGWGINDQNGYIIFSHTGGLPGMLSKTTLVPELNLGVVVLTNTEPGGYSYQTISRSIIDSYLGVRIDRISRAEASLKRTDALGDSVVNAVWNKVKSAKADHVKLADFTGTYEDDWFGKITVTQKDGKLWFTCLRSPKLHGQMFYYKGNTFAIQWNYRDIPCDAFATFTLNEEGVPVQIKMRGISPNIDFSFDFHDLDLKRIN